MKKEASGAIIILAYPEEFVSMIPAWYRKPMEWIGMVNDGKTCVGHAAMALVNKASGKIYYADFGRYITPFGYGRTRMEFTDPDVAFDYRVAFDDQGEIVDKIALFQHIYEHPEKTHGGDAMFVSLNQEVDFQKCYDWIVSMNNKGSIIYDPFGKGRSNCSRFVYDSILNGVIDPLARKKLKRKSPVTPSPLANVFFGTNEESYEFSPRGHEVVQDKSLRRILSYFFTKPPKNAGHSKSFQPKTKMDFLGGIGDQAYFYTNQVKEHYLEVTKLDYRGEHSFTKKYQRHPDFDPKQAYTFIHDCNAAWITVKQNDQTLRMNTIQVA